MLNLNKGKHIHAQATKDGRLVDAPPGGNRGGEGAAGYPSPPKALKTRLGDAHQRTYETRARMSLYEPLSTTSRPRAMARID